ncbi:MAG: response regulator [Syntrophales bacterium]|nr:response regulator [Syntrophales bacterium]
MKDEKSDANGGVEILIVEDSQTQAEQLRYILEDQGYDVSVAYNGREAMNLLRGHLPTMVISDVIMPEMDGYELCRQIRADATLRDVPVILVTSLSDPRDVVRGLEAGANNFIRKPYDEKYLLSRIRHVLVNMELRKTAKAEMGINIFFGDQNYFITSDRLQILDLLLSTYETAVQQNEELIAARNELRRLNEELEQRVTERTAALTAEIEERRRTEELLRASEEKYRLLVNHANEAIYVAQDEKMRFANPKALEILGCSLEEVMTNPFMAFVHPDDQEMILSNYRKRLAGEKMLETYPFRIVRKDGCVRWVEISAVKFAWDSRPATLNFASDVTQKKKTEEDLLTSCENLRKAMEGTIQAMAMTVGSRDSYTAGHQRRVTGLALAIAHKMFLEKRIVESIAMAGAIHDIGKISIPAEILSKPGRLSAIEFDLIKSHSRAGYNILKDIEFPWPVAQVVYQHHERINGTGYPQGLKGEGILQEARIIAVADVVEAMATHRPYRPALGIEKALEEIRKNRGILYDAEAVDACDQLFTQNGYAFI